MRRSNPAQTERYLGLLISRIYIECVRDLKINTDTAIFYGSDSYRQLPYTVVSIYFGKRS